MNCQSQNVYTLRVTWGELNNNESVWNIVIVFCVCGKILYIYTAMLITNEPVLVMCPVKIQLVIWMCSLV